MTGKRIAAVAVLLLLAAAAVLTGCLKPLYAAYRAYEVSFGEETRTIMDEIRAGADSLMTVCGDADALRVDALLVDALRQAVSAYDKAGSPAERREACLAVVSAARECAASLPDGGDPSSAQTLARLLTVEMDRLADALSDTPNTAAAAAEFNRLRNSIPTRWFCALFGIREI